MSASDVATNPLFSHSFDPRPPTGDATQSTPSQSPSPPAGPHHPPPPPTSQPLIAQNHDRVVQDLAMEGGEETAGTPPPPPTHIPPVPSRHPFPYPTLSEIMNAELGQGGQDPGFPGYLAWTGDRPAEASRDEDGSVHPSESEGDEDHSEDHEDDEDDEEDDEDQGSRWQPIVEDTNQPCGDEIAYIRSKEEHSALDHAFWEKSTFFDVGDPEIKPGEHGRIDWLVEGFNGTKDKPNNELIMRSPTVKIGGLEWLIKFFPKGNGGDFLSVYVVCKSMTEDSFPETELVQNPPLPVLAGSPPLRKRRSVAAQMSVVMYNPGEPRVYEHRSDAHQFHKKSPDHGWRYFSLEPRQAFHLRQHGQRQAILRDDKLAFSAYIRILDDPTGCMWEHGMQTAEDSIAVTGLRPFSCITSSVAASIPLYHLAPFRNLLQACEPTKMTTRLQEITLKMLARGLSRKTGRPSSGRKGEPLQDCVEALQRLRQSFGKHQIGDDSLDHLLGTLKTGVASDRLLSENCRSVQEAIDTHATLLDTPPVLTLELQRQKFTKERKWKRVTNRVEMNNVIYVLDAIYTLFAFVTHRGHLQSSQYTPYVRPGATGNLWYAYEDGKVRCLTHSQAVDKNAGFDGKQKKVMDQLGFDGTAFGELAYLVFYVRDDLVLRCANEEAFKVSGSQFEGVPNDGGAGSSTNGDQSRVTEGAKSLVRLDAVLRDDRPQRGDETPAPDGDDVIMSDAEEDSRPRPAATNGIKSRTQAATPKPQATGCTPEATAVTIDYFSREYFKGTHVGSKAEGPGRLITLAGDSYEGNFKSGKYHGQGKMTYAKDGSVYEGEWVEGMRHGQGRLTQKDRTYVGGWKDGKQAGRFTLTGEVTDDDKSSCQVCYGNEINCVFYDCGHAIACKECAGRINDCPVCRRKVMARVEVFGVKLSLE